ncbi:MAG: flagellar basal body-associated protein FliL [Burkholderiaceae bacterium]|nr:flagellar basal body-associated protein FliL [Burkholderiaceae bacterium]
MKANPKAKAEPKVEAAAPVNSKKKLIMIVGLLVVLAAGGGGAWVMLKGGGGDHEEAPVKAKQKSAKLGPPTYVTLEPFTVNLQQENGEQYLQVAFSVQVGGLEDSDNIKNNMAKVRSRVLLLLSSKRASEINTPEGKQQLSQEIQEQIKEPFDRRGPEQDVVEVLFTSFIIQ